MNDLISASKLSFLTINRYTHDEYNFFDAEHLPRPHFCMAILERGRAVFHDCENGKDIELLPGDVIFVVQGCCYCSRWWGEPEISYTSIHFSFEHMSAFPKDGKFYLQKVSGELLPDGIEKSYESMLQSCADGGQTFKTLEYFYKILGSVVPHLGFKSAPRDLRIASAIEYIEKNYQRSVTAEELAAHSNMSVSRFFPRFREETGMTPVEYINSYRVNRAILLLISNSGLSIEQIAELTGFESSAYFRRVFKAQTGKTPREYRTSAIEI